MATWELCARLDAPEVGQAPTEAYPFGRPRPPREGPNLQPKATHGDVEIKRELRLYRDTWKRLLQKSWHLLTLSPLWSVEGEYLKFPVTFPSETRN